MTIPEIIAALRAMHKEYTESGSSGGHWLAESVRELHNKLDALQDQQVS